MIGAAWAFRGGAPRGTLDKMQRVSTALRASLAGLLLLAPPPGVRATEPVAGPPEAWRTSPFHGVISGATGEPIPCRCRFKDTAFRLGETVCMNTYLGVQLARCDLLLNNTTWVPTGVPCTISSPRDRRSPAAG
jgi:hypothetical protein